jgi:PAS domain S-box-containing protein
MDMRKTKTNRLALKVAFTYVIVAGIWILLSDELLKFFIGNPEKYATLSVIKGLGFVLVTGGLLHQVLRRLLRQWENEAAQRSQAEATKQDAEERYRRLFAVQNDAVILMDCQTYRILEVNPAAEKMYGYSRAEFLRLDAAQVLQENGKTGSTMATEVKHVPLRMHRRKDGSAFAVEISYSDFVYQNRKIQVAAMRDITKSKAAETAMSRLASIVESSDDAIFTKSPDGIILTWNRGAERVYGYAASEVIGKPVAILVPPDRLEELQEVLGKIRQGEPVLHHETIRLTKAGRRIDVSLSVSAMKDASGNLIGISSIASDITGLKEREREVARLSRLYAALSQVNQAIVWTPRRAELFEKICRVLVEFGGFRMAWIGQPDAETRQVHPVAQWGDNSDYLSQVTIYADERPEGRGPTGTALREGRNYICNDFTRDPGTVPWHELADRAGFRASATFPIRQGGVIYGALTIYSGETGFFRDKEVTLLEEAATDLSFALDNFAREASRQQAEAAMRRSREEFKELFDNAPVGFHEMDAEGRLVRINNTELEMLGYTAEELTGQFVWKISAEEETTRRTVLAKLAGEMMPSQDFERSFRRKNGSVVPVLINDRMLKWEDGRIAGMHASVQDITERKRAETNLRERERQLATLMANLPGMVYRCRNDQDWTMKFVSDGAQALTGYSASELTDNRVVSYASLIHPDDREIVQDQVQASLKRGGPFVLNYRLRPATGGERWVWEQGRGVFDDQHRLVAFEGFITDITESKQAAQALASERALLRTLLNHLPVAVYLKDLAGRKTLANPIDLRNCGVATEAEILGRTDFDFFPPEQAAAFQADDQRVFDGQPVSNREEQLTSPGGSTRWLLTSKVPLFDAAGRVTGLAGIGLDISERKQADAALCASEEKFSKVFRSSPVPVSLSTIKEGRYLDVNAEFLKLYGWSREEMIGHTAFELNIWANPEDRAAVVSKVKENGSVHNFELDIHTRSGELRRILWSVEAVVIGDEHCFLGTSLDITERQRAEREIQRQAAFAQFNPNPVLELSATGEVLYFNAAARQMADSLGQEHPSMLLPPNSAAIVRDCLATNQPNLRLEILAKGRTISWSFFPVAQNRVVHCYGGDITARKQVEAALNYERDLWRMLLDTSPDHIYFKDAQSRFIKVSKALARRVSLESADEMLGRTDFDFFTEPHARSAFEDEQEIIRTGRPLIAKEEREVWKDGHVTWASSTKIPMRDDSGEIIGIMGISRDITEHKLVEESNARLAMAVEQAVETVVITDTDGAILYANPAFEKTSGYTRAEVLGQNPRILKSGKQDAGFYRRMWDALGRGETWSGHFTNKRKDGTFYEEEATISPVRDAAGAVVNYVAVKRDVTHEVQIEAELRQSQKMEAVGKLAAGVSHDFNNILAVIQLQAGLLKAESSLSPVQLDYAAEIEKATQRAADLTRQLLVFGRKQVLQLCDLDLNVAVANMTKMLHRIVGEDVQLKLEFSSEPLWIHADAGTMDQILLNLTVNARDAMPKGGRLIIGTSAVMFDEVMVAQSPQARPGSYVCLNVTDTGCGIAPEILPHIFEPFFTTKEVGKGTGLGLATVWGIVEQQHGWISVYSEAGHGTTFRVFLPRLMKTPNKKAGWASLASIVGGKETILLVEDDPSVRRATQTSLTRCGYRVLEAPTGIIALEVWRQHHGEIQLLLTDMVMPDGMNGKELARRLLQENPRLKVIYASGYCADVAGEDLVLQEGVNFLTKPFEAHKLMQVVRNCLDAV